MSNMSFEEKYAKILTDVGLASYAGADLAARFHLLSDDLVAFNEKVNLTAITDDEGIILRHFADCLTIADLLPENARVCDVGCGGGFPTLPVSIARPDLHFTSLDSTAKKLVFVEECAEKYALSLRTLAGRAEEFFRTPAYREHFDAVVSRAVASLPILSELCLPAVKVGGVFLAMKGAGADEELAAAGNAIRMLGGEVIDKKYFSLGDAGERCVIVVKKAAKTPEKYPRAFGAIKKKPL